MKRDKLEKRNSSLTLLPSDQLPGLVRSFVAYFTRYVTEGNIAEIHSIYENSFNKLTERFFKSSPWPTAAVVAPLLGSDVLPTLLYKELYYRHLFSRLSPSLADRENSWKNYLELFAHLNSQGEQIKLPHSWLFDLIDEFVWQAQSFNHYRSKLKNMCASDKTALASQTELWSIVTVLRTLEIISAKSGVSEFLKEEKQMLTQGQKKEYVALGYFALVGQLRVHCMMGDYYTALRAIDSIKMMSGNDQELFCSTVTPCHITLYYYTGFCYLMLRRYADATLAFSNILVFLASAKQSHTRSNQWELIVKKQDQMLSLLAMSLSLTARSPMDGILEELREKHSDHLNRLRKGDSNAYEELFASSCPKFVSCVLPAIEGTTNTHLEAAKFQQNLFLKEVRQQARIPNIRSYLKLYSSIDTTKLASFLNISVPELRALLLSCKHKSRSFEHVTGAPVSGQWVEERKGDTSFFVSLDMVHVSETKTTKSYIEPLLDGIHKLDDMVRVRRQ